MKTVTLIPGDGIGPEVADAVVRVLHEADAPITWERCEAGEAVFARGNKTGVPAETIESITRNGVALKSPLGTPVGYGEKSANVTLRKMFETYGNLRPCREIAGITTPFTGRGIDLVVVRENVEDLYAGIEHLQTPGVAQCLKLMSRKGCEKIVRLAFEIARAEGRGSVHCATKANIMKLTEGLMKHAFEAVSEEYPDIRAEHIIIDNCAHQLVMRPEKFEVIVTSNMNGDIISDLTSGLIGGLGLAPSANIGTDVSIFEAVHGSAPDIAGRGLANPTALLLSSVLLLRHVHEFAIADQIEQSILATYREATATTKDIRGSDGGGTDAFVDAVIGHLGDDFTEQIAGSRTYAPVKLPVVDARPDFVRVTDRRVVGVDVFIEHTGGAEVLGDALTELAQGTAFELGTVTNRGTSLYPPPDYKPLADLVDHWPCRFMARDCESSVTDAAILELLAVISQRYQWMHVEKLQRFDGAEAFTKAQGER